DVESLRVALGLDKITLWGGSYGSHLALAYLRNHSDHVERAVLTKVEGPDHTFKLPSSVQSALDKVSALAAEDDALKAAMPSLTDAIRTLAKRLEKEPVTVKVETEDGDVEIVVGAFDLRREIAGALGGIRSLAEVPAQVHAMLEGDFSELGAAALQSRRSEVWSMMTVMMDCASGASAERWKRIAREAANPANLTGDTINAPFGPLVREAAGDVALPAAFREPIQSDAKVLFVTGSLDARTPPSNLDDIAPGFPNHVHIAVTGVTHDSFEMLSPDYQRVLRAFLNGEEVKSQTIGINEMRFRPLGRRGQGKR
ncbi:MAG: alpha/beta hydrolase, partial [Planctomycetota bacterium]